MWGKKTAPNYFSNNLVKPRSILIIFGKHVLNKFYVICIFTFIAKQKRENQLKIYLSYWLTDENEYIHDSFVVVSKLKNIKIS